MVITYTDPSEENIMRYKDIFYEADKHRHKKNEKRFSQIPLLKLAFEGKCNNLSDENKFSQSGWQKTPYIVGPAKAKDFFDAPKPELRNAFESFILNHSNENTKLLDAGSNAGILGYRLYSKVFCGIYVGVDSNLKALLYAIDNLEGTPASFCLADLSEINFPNNYFDIVFSRDVIEHQPNYEPILKELARLTSKYLILSIFIKFHDGQDLINFDSKYEVYLNRYNRQKIYDFLQNLGLKNPKIIYSVDDDEVIIFEKSPK